MLYTKHNVMFNKLTWVPKYRQFLTLTFFYSVSRGSGLLGPQFEFAPGPNYFDLPRYTDNNTA